MSLKAWMRETVTITTPGAPVDDGAGGSTPGASTTTTTRGALVASGNSPQERTIAAQVGPRVLWTVTLPKGTVIGSSATIGIRGRTFEVIAPLDGTHNAALPVACVELT